MIDVKSKEYYDCTQARVVEDGLAVCIHWHTPGTTLMGLSVHLNGEFILSMGDLEDRDGDD